MGYYIEVPNDKQKAEQLVELHGAQIILKPKSFNDVPEGKGLICVVDNGMFEAAAFCYSAGEFKEFETDYGNGGNQRPRKWVLLDIDKAKKLSGCRR